MKYVHAVVSKLLPFAKTFLVIFGLIAIFKVLFCTVFGNRQGIFDLYHDWIWCLIAAIGLCYEETFKAKKGITHRDIKIFALLQLILICLFAYFSKQYIVACIFLFNMGKEMSRLWKNTEKHMNPR